MSRMQKGSRVVMAACWAAYATACNDSTNQALTSVDATADAVESGTPDTGEGGHDSGAVDSSDATLPEGAAVEAAAPDASAASDADAAATGSTLIQAGANLVVEGVTQDDFVVYLDTSSSTYYAVSVHGGTPTPIVTVPSGESAYPAVDGHSPAVFMFGNLVFIYTIATSPTYVTTLTLWSSALSAPVPVSTAALIQYGQTAWPSNDSKYFVYTRVTSSDATVGAIYGVNGDGTNPTLLVPDVALQPTSCVVQAKFAGGYVVLSYCPSADAGSAVVQAGHTVQAFSLGGGWPPALAVPDALASFVVDPDGTQVVAAPAASDAGGLHVFPIDGGEAGVGIDPSTPFGARQFLVGSTSTPWYVAYNTPQGALRQTVVSPLSTQTLVDAGVNRLDTPSVDGKWVAVTNQFTSSSGFPADLSVASTANPGPLEALATTTADAGPISVFNLGGAFTSDDQYLIYLSNIVRSSQGGTLYTVSSAQIAPPNAVRSLSNGEAINILKLTGSKVLLVDNFQDVDGSAGAVPTADLDVVDPASTTSSSTVVSGVPIFFDTGIQARNVAVTSDHSRIVYGIAQGGAPGIYVTSVP
jgi:hypothetical protein